jgi:hypothetical protein
MTIRKPPVFAAALVALAAGLCASPTMAASVDTKSISPSVCQPRGPDTTVSELTYSPYGITNPGSTNVSVICPINGDAEQSWGSETAGSPYVGIHYRAGAIAGFVGCTVFTGSAAFSALPTYSKSYTPPPSPANGRGSFHLSVADPSGSNATPPPTVLICTISPKATLGFIYLREPFATDVQQ